MVLHMLWDDVGCCLLMLLCCEVLLEVALCCEVLPDVLRCCLMMLDVLGCSLKLRVAALFDGFLVFRGVVFYNKTKNQNNWSTIGI